MENKNNKGGQGFQQKKPFQRPFQRPLQTRTLRNDTPVGQSAQSTQSAQSSANASGHRIVLGKAARRAMQGGKGHVEHKSYTSVPRPANTARPSFGSAKSAFGSGRSSFGASKPHTPSKPAPKHIAGARMNVIKKVGKLIHIGSKKGGYWLVIDPHE
jgi:hypothetical protein